MAEVKWIKLMTDMFDNRKIRQIECLPEGDAIIVIWVKLLCLAGIINDSGMVYLTKEIPYTEQMLATQFGKPLTTVQLAIGVLQQFGMIEVIDDVLKISNWSEYQNIEGMDRIREQNRLRKQKERERKKAKLIGSGNTCEYCGNEGDTIDHIIPISKGGLDVPENTVRACLDCNMKKTNRDVDVFLNELINTREKFDVSIILKNEKIMEHVYYDGRKFVLRDVTGHVTQCHATEEERRKKKEDKEIDKENNTNIVHSNADIDAFFDVLWNQYPVKKGKGQVSSTARKKLYDIGMDEMQRAIHRYLSELQKDSDWRKPQNGSTFFNSGYIDYLDANYEPQVRTQGTSKNKTADMLQESYDMMDEWAKVTEGKE